MAGYKKPMHTAKCMKDGGSVKMQEQMRHGSFPHSIFQETGRNMLEQKEAGMPVNKKEQKPVKKVK